MKLEDSYRLEAAFLVSEAVTKLQKSNGLSKADKDLLFGGDLLANSASIRG